MPLIQSNDYRIKIQEAINHIQAEFQRTGRKAWRGTSREVDRDCGRLSGLNLALELLTDVENQRRD